MNWDLLWKFQTVLVGVLGFSGVILTLRTNARLAREERHDQVQHTKQVVATALAAELLQLKVFLLSVKEARLPVLKFLVTSEPPVPPVYTALLNQIGFLDAEQINAVVVAYGNTKIFVDVLRLSFAEDAPLEMKPESIVEGVEGVMGYITTALERLNYYELGDATSLAPKAYGFMVPRARPSEFSRSKPAA